MECRSEMWWFIFNRKGVVQIKELHQKCTGQDNTLLSLSPLEVISTYYEPLHFSRKLLDAFVRNKATEWLHCSEAITHGLAILFAHGEQSSDFHRGAVGGLPSQFV
ncbi:hypothetical protein AVEN_82235-1 [Araneus ventricosus]|uniref:Uncharacterized protein n=1 Tax=Araneus ventricosus TaxID=182803 RepID=A0A4Y2WSV4_ARAVE|nr:hypothetical protein AVEN_242857-1 [Araneus ventricosus]GBO40483.1 hypothetical protein AVEN_53095-1 [Araneus ventricosus]GBO40484.1 hypothetical protein AVEN_65950-1 [Araneus ventricosus]GBO40485.1 hypothetical protein AVEN_82235-1 [Araneus ventricosus]